MISQPRDWLHWGDAWNILLALSYNQSPSHLYVFIFIFWPCLLACRLLFPWSRMETVSTAVKAQSPNHWCLIADSCPTLCDPMDYSPPGSSARGDSPSKNTGVGCHFLLQGSLYGTLQYMLQFASSQPGVSRLAFLCVGKWTQILVR